MPVPSSVSRPARPLILLFLALATLGLLAAGVLVVHPALALAEPQQTVTPTLAPGTGGIVGIAWNDLDGDGEQDTGEPFLAGLTVMVQSGQLSGSAISGADGSYYLGNLQPALYRLTALPPAGYQLTTAGVFDVFVSSGAIYTLDFGAWFVPTPTPSPTEPPLLNVEGATQALCGGVYRGDTRTGRSNVSRYGCRMAWNEGGPEVVYRIELDRSQTLSASLLSATADLDLFLLRYVYPDSCVAAGDNVFSYEAERGVYFLAVDGYEGAAGDFTLRVDCPYGVQATATWTPIPSPTPTATMTFTPGPTPTATATRALQPRYLPLLLQEGRAQAAPESATIVFQGGVNGYEGAADATLDAWNPATAYGTAPELRLAYARPPKVTTQMASVLRFDLDPLPPEAQIVDAQLKIYLLATAPQDLRGEVHALLRGWDEGAVTWTQPLAGETWGADGAQGPGVDFVVRSYSLQLIQPGNRWYTFDVTALVGEWVRSPRTNQGLILLAQAGDSQGNVQVRFASREHANSAIRPQLVVSYWFASDLSAVSDRADRPIMAKYSS